MSWIVQSLLMDKNVIKEQGLLDSDELDDLILIEKKIKELYNNRLLSDEDIQIIDEFTGDNSSFPVTTSAQRKSIRKKFSVICERIAFFLGGYFTDEGYLNYIQTKHKLSEVQTSKLRTYIKSAYRHKIIRKLKTDEKNDNQPSDF